MRLLHNIDIFVYRQISTGTFDIKSNWILLAYWQFENKSSTQLYEFFVAIVFVHNTLWKKNNQESLCVNNFANIFSLRFQKTTDWISKIPKRKERPILWKEVFGGHAKLRGVVTLTGAFILRYCLDVLRLTQIHKQHEFNT